MGWMDATRLTKRASSPERLRRAPLKGPGGRLNTKWNVGYPIALKIIWSVLWAPVTAVQPGNTPTCASASQAFVVADLLDAVLNGCGQWQFEDISERLAGLPFAEVRQTAVDRSAQGVRRESD